MKRLLLRGIRTIAHMAVTLTISAIVLFLSLQVIFLLHIWWYQKYPPNETAFMTHRMAQLHQKKPNAKLQYIWVAYPNISRNLKRAMVAAEDSKFVEHEGFDWDGIQYAMEKNRARGKTVAGGSTITQQLAKNLFLSSQKSYLRKGQEAIITLMLEYVLEKERILELYLNVIEWGNGIFGAEAAARRYFGVSAARLSPEQAARLAAMAPNPRFYEHNPNAFGLRRKTSIILARMSQAELPQ